MLGDSFTEGVGAPSDSCYPRQLENLFGAAHDSSVQVINGGVCGSDLFFEYKLLLAFLPKYQPDVVIVTCNSSDVNEYITRGGFERFLPNDQIQYRKPPWFEWFYARSLVVRLIVHDVFHYDFSFIRMQDRELAMREADSHLSAAIDSFQTFCQSKHIQFGIVFHPGYPEVSKPELYQLKNLVTYCRDKNIPYSDELPYLSSLGYNETNWTNIYWTTDGHFNPKGYGLLAGFVYQFIERKSFY